MKIGRKIRRIFSVYNIAIFLCLVVIIVALFIIFKSSGTKTTIDGVKIAESKLKDDEELSEDDAKKLAIKQFEYLGEYGLKADELSVKRIRRSSTVYYYIVSPENNLEIKVQGGEITRINSVVVEIKD